MVDLVLNLVTSTITPQFHIVFDDMFSTVTSNELYGVKQIYDLHIKIMILVMQLRGRILRPRPRRHKFNPRQCWKLLDKFNLEEIGRW